MLLIFRQITFTCCGVYVRSYSTIVRMSNQKKHVLLTGFLLGSMVLFVVHLHVTSLWKLSNRGTPVAPEAEATPDQPGDVISWSIPLIIHQTWDSTAVPRKFVPWMRSWTHHHPQWQYWFWTPDDVRYLLRQRYPDFVQFYDRYPTILQRADVMRYFVLYTFGGVYADLDMECLKPIDPLLFNRSCVFSEEPYEHVYILNRRVGDANVMNCIMACRSGHPFFKELLDKLPQTKNISNRDAVATTGPFFVDSVLKQYQANLTIYRPIKDVVTVIPPQYLLPTFDQGQLTILQSRCFHVNRRNDNPHIIGVCQRLRARNYANKPSTLAYATHYWVHVVMFSASWKTKDVVDIHDIILDPYPGKTITEHNLTREYYGVPLVQMGPFLSQDEQNRSTGS